MATARTVRKVNGMSNPAAMVVASSSAGQSAIRNAAETKAEVVKQTASVIPFALKGLLLLGAGYMIYRAWSNRFIKMKEVSRYSAANITESQAMTRADAIYSSIGWVSNDFDNVRNQFAGLNYNAVVRVYNAFGERRGTLFAGRLTLFEWLNNQFTPAQMAELRFLIPGFF